MTFQIRRLGIYNAAGVVRPVEFKLGALNIVTGASKTGKSSLGKIIDYCLGAEKFGVAAGVIREHVVHYALILERDGEQLLVARSAPAPGHSTTSTMHVRAGRFSQGFPPLATLVSNSDLDSAIAVISRFGGIEPNLTDPAGGSRPAFDATVRHAMFFVIQAQNEIANQDVLFHRQSQDDFRPSTIRDVMPYFVGATDPSYTANLEELRRLRKEASQLRRMLLEQSALAGPSGQAIGLVSEAVEVGLLAPSQVPPRPTQQMLVALLVEAATGALDPTPIFGQDYAGDDLRSEGDRLTDQFAEMKGRVRHLSTLQAETDAFTSEASEQLTRLQSVGVFSNVEDALGLCPICSADLEGRVSDVEDLRRVRDELIAEADQVSGTAPRIEAALSAARDELADLNLALVRNRQAVADLESTRESFDELRDSLAERALVRGRISLYLDSVERTAVDVSAQHRLDVVEEQIDRLEAQLDASSTRERLESALSVISANIGEIAANLELEHSDAPIRLSMRQLTVIADTEDGPVALDEMGAGENWVGYHVATYLALHRLFVARSRPVPRFLFLDQPSQVYFPPDDPDIDAPDSSVTKDPDREGLRRLLRQVQSDVEEAGGALQVILTDHADLQEDWFMQLVEYRWRRGEDALVPIPWLT